MILTSRQKIKVGLFLLVGTSIMILSLMILAGIKLWEPRNLFRARFKESIGGLERNAPVKYQGLRVGRVDNMLIAKDDPSAIDVILALDPQVVLYQGTTALLDMSGLTGIKTINLIPGDLRTNPIPVGSVLPTGTGQIDQITTSAALIAVDIQKATKQLTQWLNEENRQRLETLIGNLNIFIGHINTLMENPNSRDLLSAIHQTTVAIGATAQQATHTLQTTGMAVEQAEHDLQHALSTFTKPLADIDPQQVAQTFATLPTTLHKFNQLVENMDDVLRVSREDFTSSLSYVRQAAEDLREFSRILAQNPAVLVRGREEGD